MNPTTMPMPTTLSAIIAPSRLNQYLAIRLGCRRYRIRFQRFFGSVAKYAARRRALASLRAFQRAVRPWCNLIDAPLLVTNVFLPGRRRPRLLLGLSTYLAPYLIV